MKILGDSSRELTNNRRYILVQRSIVPRIMSEPHLSSITAKCNTIHYEQSHTWCVRICECQSGTSWYLFEMHVDLQIEPRQISRITATSLNLETYSTRLQHRFGIWDPHNLLENWHQSSPSSWQWLWVSRALSNKSGNIKLRPGTIATPSRL